jgi:hypothetical protein
MLQSTISSHCGNNPLSWQVSGRKLLSYPGQQQFDRNASSNSSCDVIVAEAQTAKIIAVLLNQTKRCILNSSSITYPG